MIKKSEVTDGFMSTLNTAEPSADIDDDNNRRADGDRRAEDRRRSAQGLFELRARRDRIVEDRRKNERRSVGRFFRLAFWRRTEPE